MECKAPLSKEQRPGTRQIKACWNDQQTGMKRHNSKYCYEPIVHIPDGMPNDHHAIVLYVGKDYTMQIYNLGMLVDNLKNQLKPYKDPNTLELLTYAQIQLINDKYRAFSGINQDVLNFMN